MSENTHTLDEVAVIGISCRLPQADNPDAYWDLLDSGNEAIVSLNDDDLIRVGEDRKNFSHPNYVRAHGFLADADLFDAEFFGVSPREAALIDPQHRLFLECAWSAFENAGYDPGRCPGQVGVYAGSGWNSYFLRNVASHHEFLEPNSLQQTLLGNESDTLATRVSYKLGLRGPSMTVQTACSTSLVAVAQACQSLLSYESDMALAGGVSIRTPQAGYVYQEGSIFSRSGKCRAFDAGADGTVIGSGAGAVLLKRLGDAVAAGDHIHAVVKSFAINNDGSAKVGYAAPSVEGQAAVIREAHALGGVHPETITYVEAHGTGTIVGDPIEIAALTDVFRSKTDKIGYCAIGSVKTNVGHLDAAAGVAGLIKTILALQNRRIPASLNFERPNPAIDFANSPFYVNTRTTDWRTTTGPRRAGVSSFGIGGTNAHVVLEEAPPAPSAEQNGAQVLPLSAQTAAALDRRVEQLRHHLQNRPAAGLADIAYTLQRGRRAFAHRRAIVASTVEDAICAIEPPSGFGPAPAFLEGRQAAFMFSGQGPQHVGMARRLYSANPVFRAEADRCFDLLLSRHGLDLRELIYPTNEHGTQERDAALTETWNAQPGLFVLQYSLAKTLEHCGVRMAAGVGHSFGEYSAATLAGVFALEDALSVVVTRGRLLQNLPAGAMLAVPLGPDAIEPLLGSDVSIAVVNHPASCVVAGPRAAVETLRDRLSARDVDATVLRISYASHTAMVDPALKPFAEHLARIRLNPPQVPFLSSVTGTWITDEQATDPGYWVAHLREQVRFADGLERIFRDTTHILVELGPNEVLTSLAKRHPAADPSRIASPALPHRSAPEPDDAVFLRSIGSLWSSGVEINWEGLHHGAQRSRVPLPTYPFERQRHWIAPRRDSGARSEILETAIRESRDEAVARIAGCDLLQREAKVQLLEQLSSAYINDAIQALGGQAPGSTTVHPGFVERSCVLPAYRSLVVEWADMLNRLRQGKTEKNAAPTAQDPDEIEDLLARARQAWPGQPEVELVQRCGTALLDVLRGGIDPIGLFTPLLDRAFSEPDKIFGTEYASVIRRAVSGVLTTELAAKGLRVLEIGGGTGITTSQVVRELADSGRGHRYVFTDISDAFVAHAGRRHGEHPWFSAAQLDIEKPPAEQGLKNGSFDVVIAANVLHATSDLQRTLEHVRSLLAPGGLLLLAEITTPTLDFAMTYGLLMGPVADPDRTQSAPFLSRELWEHRLFTEFESVASTPEDNALGHHVFIAQNAERQRHHHHPHDGDVRGIRKEDDIGKWFRVPSWKRTATVRRLRNTKQSGAWLVLDTSSELDTEFRRLLREKDQHVVTVRQGQGFRRQDESSFEVDHHAAHDYQRVLTELAADGVRPSRIVCMWALAAPHDLAALEQWRSLVALATAIDHAGLAQPVDLTVVSSCLHDVLGEHTEIGASLLLGLCRVIPLEYSGITGRSVDFVVPKAKEDPQQITRIAAQLADEVFAAQSDAVVAYRSSHRWVETVEPIALDKRNDQPAVRRDGVYLITGGLGTIGSAIAQHLVGTVGAKVVLVGRSGRGRDESTPWHDGNPNVMVMAADVTDAERMRVVVETAESQFGPINGVIHSAGLLGDGAIAHKTVEDFERVLAPKVAGTLVLHELFKGRDLDFLVLFSSLSARKPGFGQAAYAAANCFLDSFAHSALAASHRLVTCINWDIWQGGGMAYDAEAPQVLQKLKLADFAQRGILPAQGVDAFYRALESGLPQVYVTSSNYLEVLDDKHRDLSQVYLDSIEHASAQHHHARPELATEYVEPRNSTEQMLADIWHVLLGIERVGVADDFFRLGGDSLLGSQFVTRVRNTFAIHLSARVLYEHPTIEKLAKVVDDALIRNANPEAVIEAVKQVKSKS